MNSISEGHLERLIASLFEAVQVRSLLIFGSPPPSLQRQLPEGCVVSDHTGYIPSAAEGIYLAYRLPCEDLLGFLSSLEKDGELRLLCIIGDKNEDAQALKTHLHAHPELGAMHVPASQELTLVFNKAWAESLPALQALLSDLTVPKGIKPLIDRLEGRPKAEQNTAGAPSPEHIAELHHRERILLRRNQQLRTSISRLRNFLSHLPSVSPAVEPETVQTETVQNEESPSMPPNPLHSTYRRAAALQQRLETAKQSSVIRKLRKLQRDPIHFWQDSKPAAAMNRQFESLETAGEPLLQRLPGGKGTLRKWRKLRRDPSAFLRDSKLLAWRDRQLKMNIALIAKSEFFDLEYYRRMSGRSAVNEWEAIRHYLEIGASVGLSPHPGFDGPRYLAAHPDVRAAGVNPLLHYLKFGRNEGREMFATPLAMRPTWRRLRAEMELIRGSGYFDPVFYNEQRDDQGIHQDPVEHFVTLGWVKGFSPSPRFDTKHYLQSNRDVREARINPLYHFLVRGRDQGRQALESSEALTDEAVKEALKWAKQCDKKFSVVMPTWNRRDTISKAIDSVLAQSYLHFELIISDDASTDGTEAYIRNRYADELASGKIVYKLNPHLGVSGARNAGLRECKNEWIAYLDSDNSWREHYLLLMGHALDTTPDRRAAYSQLAGHDQVQDREFVLGRHFDRVQLIDSNYIDLNVYAHERSLYDEYGGFDESLKRLVDWDMILRHLHSEQPIYVPHIQCDYYLSRGLNNITHKQPLAVNREAVLHNLAERLEERPHIPRIGQMTFLVADTKATDELATRIADDLASLEIKVEAAALQSDEALLAAEEAQWIHGHEVPADGFLDLVSNSQVSGFSFRPQVDDIFKVDAPDYNRDPLHKLAWNRRCAAVFVENQLQEQSLVARGIPRHKLLRVPTVPAWAEPRLSTSGSATKSASTQERLQVLVLGPTDADSGVTNLVEACASIPERVTLRIAGAGSQEPLLRNQVRTLGADNVSFLPAPTSTAERKEVLRSADVLAFAYAPSSHLHRAHVPDDLYLACTEGIPIAMTRTALTREFLREEVSCFALPVADSEGIAGCLKNIHALAPALRRRVAENALSDMQATHSPAHASHTFAWLLNTEIEIVLVATDGINWDHFVPLVHSLQLQTTLPARFHIVDNGCSHEYSDQIRLLAGEYSNIVVHRFDEMVGLGVASNHVFDRCTGEFIIYVCANEGAIVGRGWERPVLHFMAQHPDVAMGGTLVHSPAWLLGREYETQPWFADFRNKEFAANNPQRQFAHVQGGLFVLRRSIYKKHGGFHLPHNHMDVEYSYYLESIGLRIADVPAILALSAKTRPTFIAHLDEMTRAVHPIVEEQEAELLLRSEGEKDARLCTLTGELELGTPPRASARGGICKDSQSSGFERAAHRYLALSGLEHRGLQAATTLKEGVFLTYMRGCFKAVAQISLGSEPAQEQFDLLVVDELSDAGGIVEKAFRWLKPNGMLLVASEEGISAPAFPEHQIERLPYQSRLADYGLQQIYAIRRRNQAVAQTDTER